MDTLTALLQALDAPAARYSRLDRYYAGNGPLSYLSPEAVAVLGDRLRRVSSNIPKVLVDSVAERLRVTGFQGADVWDDWLRCSLDQQSVVAHKEALIVGSSWTIVWADPFGRPKVTIESAHQMAGLRDPGSRNLQTALKKWETATTTEAVMYGPEVITRYRANHTGATTAGFKVVDEIANPLGVVPVVRFTNVARLLDDDGRSEMEDVLDLSDALTKLLTDMLVASETTARPRRWASGVELVENEDGETVSPFSETMKMLIAENDSTKFGQLPGAELGGYKNAIDVVMRQLSAVSGLPPHALGLGGDNPTSADSIRASEAALTARAEGKMAGLGQSWEDVARLIVGVRDGADPQQVDVRVEWADAATRSEAAVADAVTKYYQSGLLPASYALKRLGYSEDEIAEVLAARSRDAVANIDVAKVFGQ